MGRKVRRRGGRKDEGRMRRGGTIRRRKGRRWRRGKCEGEEEEAERRMRREGQW